VARKCYTMPKMSKTICFRLDEKQYAEFAGAARAASLPLSAWIKAACNAFCGLSMEQRGPGRPSFADLAARLPHKPSGEPWFAEFSEQDWEVWYNMQASQARVRAPGEMWKMRRTRDGRVSLTDQRHKRRYKVVTKPDGSMEFRDVTAEFVRDLTPSDRALIGL
jgi:hypothetical protein